MFMLAHRHMDEKLGLDSVSQSIIQPNITLFQLKSGTISLAHNLAEFS